ncbi:MAG: hypothetical protein C5B59_14200 [Bacteroidetes bacterium]|nr:MAG: hypothetical protein C5B59_14200 [Bacteroidota bacterium]
MLHSKGQNNTGQTHAVGAPFSKDKKRLYGEIKDRLGVLPNLFQLPSDNTGYAFNLWSFSVFAYLDNPLASLFKERLFVYLSVIHKKKYSLLRHVGFLIGLGNVAGDELARPQSVNDVIKLLEKPLPVEERLEKFIKELNSIQPGIIELPEPDSNLEEAIFGCTAHVFLQTEFAPKCFGVLSQIFSASTFQYLLIFVAYVRTEHFWSAFQTDLTIENDLEDFLASHNYFSEILRKKFEADLDEVDLDEVDLDEADLDEVDLKSVNLRLMIELKKLRKERNRINLSYKKEMGVRRIHEETILKANAELTDRIDELVIANEAIKASRKAALNLMEDAILAEEGLRLSEGKVKAITKLVPVLLWEVDSRGQSMSWNNRWLDYTGQTPKESRDGGWIDAIHPEERLYAEEAFTKGFANEYEFEQEFRIRRHDGEYRWFLIRHVPMKNDLGQVIQWYGAASDIQDRKMAEEQLKNFSDLLEKQVEERTSELQKQHDILRQAEELAQGGSWEYNVLTKEFIWSEGMHELFKIGSDTLVTPDIYKERAIEGDKMIAQKIINAIRSDFNPFEETIRINSNPDIKTIRIKGSPHKNDKGEIDKILGVNLNVTEIENSHHKIATLNKTLLAINQELNSVNSELKTFTSIAADNYIETLRMLYIQFELIATNDGQNLSNSSRANLRRAQAAIQKMKLLTDDLVSYSRLQQLGEKEKSVDLHAIIEKEIKKYMEQSDRSSVEVECDSLPDVEGYPFLISLLFHHLVDNAFKFKKEGQPFKLRITCEELSGKDIQEDGIQKDNNYNVISFRDNGIGFPQQEARKIFEMFYRLQEKKSKGSGIGLTICRKIMEMHGGVITAEGQPGVGAAFHCYFPVM